MSTEKRINSELAAECEALKVRLRNALSSEQEAIQRAHAANQTADALAVENAELNESLDSICNAYNEELTDLLDIAVKMAVKLQTPATDAALAAIEVRALEKFADSEHCSQEAHCYVHLYLSALREAK
ncbi:TPA: hypothetical protein ACK1B7_004460 [Serratia marcescens]